MSYDRFIERKDAVRNSANRLAEALDEPATDLVRDAIIQRFEFTFEITWKALKLYLEHQGHECGGPRATLKKAFAEKLISTDEEADIWLRMLEDRNLTTHAYDEEIAISIHQHIIEDYAPLFKAMAEKIQSLPWE